MYRQRRIIICQNIAHIFQVRKNDNWWKSTYWRKSSNSYPCKSFIVGDIQVQNVAYGVMILPITSWKKIPFCLPYWLSILQNISFQNSRWPNPYPALSLSPELPTVPALTLLRWREVCPLRGQVSPGITLVNSKITFPLIGRSQCLFWPVFRFSARTDLVPPLPVTRTVDMTGSNTATSQVSFCSLEHCFIENTAMYKFWGRVWSHCPNMKSHK